MKRIKKSAADLPVLPDGYFYSDTLVFTLEELGLTDISEPTDESSAARPVNRAERRARRRR
jgi:hypothetical protein